MYNWERSYWRCEVLQKLVVMSTNSSTFPCSSADFCVPLVDVSLALGLYGRTWTCYSPLGPVSASSNSSSILSATLGVLLKRFGCIDKISTSAESNDLRGSECNSSNLALRCAYVTRESDAEWTCHPTLEDHTSNDVGNSKSLPQETHARCVRRKNSQRKIHTCKLKIDVYTILGIWYSA